jgi:3-methyl-2-oxobutanoate hydroxymethyltransferase
MTTIMKDKITAPSLKVMKREGRKIVALTCYDFTMARLLNQAGADVLLVGDSLGMVKLGLSSTLPVTVEDMVYHTRIVARGNSRALLVCDMPFMSYQAADVDAVRAAGKMIQAGAEAVKLEGGRAMIPRVKALRAAQIPVIGHLGMTPQSVNNVGGYKVQARQTREQKELIADAKALEAAGVSAIVLECLTTAFAKKVQRALSIPTIGIGAGIHCDGQILVIDDLLGLTPPPLPRFVKTYANLSGTILDAAQRWSMDVRTHKFPDDAHSYS